MNPYRLTFRPATFYALALALLAFVGLYEWQEWFYASEAENSALDMELADARLRTFFLERDRDSLLEFHIEVSAKERDYYTERMQGIFERMR